MARSSLLAGLGVAAIIVLAASVGCDPSSSPPRSSSTDAPASAASTTNAQDQQYLVAAHELHMTEIEAGRAALANATTEDAREDAERFIADHTRLDADVVDVAESVGIDLPDTPRPEQQADVDAVAALEGGSFDTAWSAQRVTVHQGERTLHVTQLSQGSNPEVNQLAEEAQPVLEAHLVALTDQEPAPVETDSSGGLFDTAEPAETPASVGAGFRPAPDGLGGLALGLLLVGGGLAAAGAVVVVRERRSTSAGR